MQGRMEMLLKGRRALTVYITTMVDPQLFYKQDVCLNMPTFANSPPISSKGPPDMQSDLTSELNEIILIQVVAFFSHAMRSVSRK